MLQAKNILSTTTNVTGSAFSDMAPGGAFQATIIGTGSVSTTVTIQCSLDATNWLTLGTISLTGTTSATDGFISGGEWIWYRAVTSGTTGTVASINVLMSENS